MARKTQQKKELPPGMLVACPKCKAQLKLPKATPGALVNCPKCGTQFKLAPPPTPAAGEEPAEAPIPIKIDSDTLITFSIFTVLLLSPLMLILIWSCAVAPEYHESTIPDPVLVRPLPGNRSSFAQAGNYRGEQTDMHNKVLNAAEIEVFPVAEKQQPWEMVDQDIPLDRIHDQRLGPGQIQGGYNLIHLSPPKEGELPPVYRIDGYLTTYEDNIAFKDAVVTFWIVNSRTQKIRITGKYIIPVWIKHPTKGSVTFDFHLNVPIPLEMTRQLPVRENSTLRKDYEQITHIQPRNEVSNAVPLVEKDPNNYIEKRKQKDEVTLILNLVNPSSHALKNPMIAVDVFNADMIYLGSFAGEGTHRIKPNADFRVVVRIPTKSLTNEYGEAVTFNVRAFAQRQ